jgi:hypothetical protein
MPLHRHVRREAVMTPVFVFKHRETGEIKVTSMKHTRTLNEEWELIDSLNPVSWIQLNYLKANENEMPRVLVPHGFKVVKIPFGYQICSIPEDA